MASVFLALGTNLGNRAQNLRTAIAALAPEVVVMRESPVYETAPWGYTEQPNFLNQVVEGKTHLSPAKLLKHLKTLETDLGREPGFRYGPRLIDLDILLYDDLVFNTPELSIPHPRLHERVFVLIPLVDLAPGFVHPILQKTIQQLLNDLNQEGIHRIKTMPVSPIGDQLMEKRRFGRTGHLSTIAIFGAAAFWNITQKEADRVMEQVLAAGVNHIDIAPSYGMAEVRVGPWMPRIRDQIFLGCKTMERTKEGAWREMHDSLQRLRVDSFDLYQIHAITSFAELDEATAPGGALDAMVQARDQGMTKYIGITGHGIESPAVFREALHRFNFDSVLFPINFVQYADPYFRSNAESLIAECRQKDVGTMIIKSITKSPWNDRPHTHTTWYEPFSQADEIQTAVNFALSQDVTGICTAGDVKVLPLILKACEKFTPMAPAEQEALIARASEYEPLFA